MRQGLSNYTDLLKSNMSEQFSEQSDFYNHGYSDSGVGDAGFPDLKVVDYEVGVNGLRILNIGGGDSSDTWFLAKNNHVEVLDGSDVAVDKARAHGVHGKVSDVTKQLPYENESFDLVLLKDILEHVYDSKGLLEEAKRVTKADGEIVISLPNHFYAPFRLRMLFGGNVIWKSLMHNHKAYFNEWDYMHIRFFTWKGTKKLLDAVGLKVLKSYWDFVTLAHYSDPLMYEYAFKINNKEIKTRKQMLLYKVLVPLYKVFNVVFPKRLRSFLVSLAPGLLCAGFYIRVEKA